MLQLKYDVLRVIAKQCRDSGEDITLLHTKTRDRMQDLHSMWKGDAADKFFEEMEIELLPPLKQTAKTLFAMQDVLLRVVKLVYDADQDTANYFRKNFDIVGSFSPGGFTGMADSSFPGTGFIPGFGIHSVQPEFESANGGTSGTTGDGGSDSGGGGTGVGGPDHSQVAGQQDAPSGQGTPAGTGGGSGGTGSGSQGWSGRSGTSTGISGQGSQTGPVDPSGQGLNPPLTPDYIYGGSSAGGAAQAGGQQGAGSSGGDSLQKETGAAVGVAATTAATGAGMASLGKSGRGSRKWRKINKINK